MLVPSCCLLVHKPNYLASGCPKLGRYYHFVNALPPLPVRRRISDLDKKRLQNILRKGSYRHNIPFKGLAGQSSPVSELPRRPY